MPAKRYWNANLDTDNLSRRRGSATRLDEMLAFAETPEFEWLRDRVGDVAGRTVVDVGGGMGMHALIWARAGARVLVVDMAVERMRALRALARRAGVADRIAVVVGQAEAMPLRAATARVVFTKSVLIHTDLPAAAAEIHRVLQSDGQGAFIEPLAGNPLIRLYRRFAAPRIWRSITRYFDAGAIDDLRQPFGRLRWKPFYIVSAGSFFWQYGWRNLARFRRSLRRWRRVDTWLAERWPRLEAWAWFAAIEVRKGEE